MATPLQLVSEYYQSVIKSERLLNANVKHNIDQSDLSLTRENISLRNQVQQLTIDLNLKKQELENSKQLHKTQKALLESKLEHAKNSIKKLSGEEDTKQDRVKFHLLSPIQHEKAQKYESHPSRLKQVIDQGQATLFDDETDDTANRTDDVLFVNSLKTNNDSRFKESGNGTVINEQKDSSPDGEFNEIKKKRKLSSRKIDSNGVMNAHDNEDEEAESELRSRGKRIKGLFKI